MSSPPCLQPPANVQEERHVNLTDKVLCKRPKRQQFEHMLEERILQLPRTVETFVEIENDERLDYYLPKKHALAGHVLSHCYKVLSDHLERKKPMMFKIGLTRSPRARFYNSKYGYILEKCKWSGMTVVFSSFDATPTAFVEAAMIQHFKGDMIEFNAVVCFFCCDGGSQQPLYYSACT